MTEAQILVGTLGPVSVARLIGRTTFKVSQELREFGMKAVRDKAASIIFELSECDSVDSTILGVVAMIGLEGRNTTELVMINARPSVRAQLEGVGLARLCRFAEQQIEDVSWQNLCQAAAGAVSMGAVSNLILEAHQTLMNIDPENIPKFKDVVDLLGGELNQQ